MEPKSYKQQQKWSLKGACQSEPRDVPKHPLGQRVEKLNKKGTKFDSLFDQQSVTKQSNKS